MQKRKGHKINNIIMNNVVCFILIILISSIAVIGEEQTEQQAQSTGQLQSSESQQENTATIQSSEKTSEPAADEIQKYKLLSVEADSKGPVSYNYLAMYSIDSAVSAKAYFDEAIGYMKIAEFRKDYLDSVSALEKKGLDQGTKNKIENNGAAIKELRVIKSTEGYNIEADIEIGGDTQKKYSYNIFIITANGEQVAIKQDNSRQIADTGDKEVSVKEMITFDELSQWFTDFSKIKSVKFVLYDRLGAKPSDNPIDSKEYPYFMQQPSETVQAPAGIGTKLDYQFMDSNDILAVKATLDKADKDFYYQIKVLKKDGTTSAYPKTGYMAKTKVDGKTISITYDYIKIKSREDVSEISIIAYPYSTAEKPVYEKTEKITLSAKFDMCASECPGEGKCTKAVCNNIADKNPGKKCVWIRDSGVLLESWNFVTRASASEESGSCREEGLVPADELCPPRCTLGCSEDNCAYDKRCKIEKGRLLDTCIPTKEAEEKAPPSPCPDECDERELNEERCQCNTRCILTVLPGMLAECIENPDVVIPSQPTAKPASKSNQDILEWMYKGYGTQIKQAANKNGIDEALIYATALAETDRTALGNSVSPTCCLGLFQFCPSTALGFKDIFGEIYKGTECSSTKCGIPDGRAKCLKAATKAKDGRLDVEKSINAAAKLIKQKQDYFKGFSEDNKEAFGIASYNIGQGVINGVIIRIGGNSKDVSWDDVAGKIITDDLKNYSPYNNPGGYFMDSNGNFDENRLSIKVDTIKGYVPKVLRYKQEAQTFLTKQNQNSGNGAAT